MEVVEGGYFPQLPLHYLGSVIAVFAYGQGLGHAKQCLMALDLRIGLCRRQYIQFLFTHSIPILSYGALAAHLVLIIFDLGKALRDSEILQPPRSSFL